MKAKGEKNQNKPTTNKKKTKTHDRKPVAVKTALKAKFEES